MPLSFVSCTKDAYGLKLLKKYKRNLLENSFKILHKPSRAGSTRAVLSARSAENQPYGECTAHVYKVASELRSALQVVLKSGSEQTKQRKLLSYLERTIN
jgi:hypothetical protein